MSDEHYLKSELYERLNTDPELFEWIEQGSLDGLWYWDLKQQEHEWLSPKFMTTFGYDEGEIPHTSTWWQENIFPEDLPRVLDNFDKHCKDPDHPYDQIVRYKHKSGETIWVRCRGLVMFDDNGEPHRMIGAHTDVTSLMRTKSELERASHQLKIASEINQLALSVSNIGIWTWYVDDDTLTWDDGMFTLYQAEKEVFTGRYNEWSDRVHPDDWLITEQQLKACVAKKEKFDAVFRIIWPNNEIRHIHVSAQVVIDTTGKVTHVLGASWDVTQEKRREAELKRSNDDLASFAYAASHDLKAPLRSIKQLTTWITNDLPPSSDDVLENFDLLKDRVSRMETLLNDLLDYSQVSFNQTQAVLEQIDTKALIQALYDFLAPPGTFSLHLMGKFPTLTIAKAPFEQVLRNLIGNAIKHRKSDYGAVMIWVTEELTCFRFHVGDNGNQIPEKHREKIFDMFQTLKPKDQVEGSGMGLAMARKIVTNNQGDIGLRRHSNKATGVTDTSHSHGCVNEFYFTWPKVTVR